MIYPVSLTLYFIMNNIIVDISICHHSVISKLNRILYHCFKTLIEYGGKNTIFENYNKLGKRQI